MTSEDKKNIEVIQIDYDIKGGQSSRVSQLIHGRIVGVSKKDNKLHFYQPGVFDAIPYQKIYNGRIFVEAKELPDLTKILYYMSDFMVSTTFKPEEELNLRTGRDRWTQYAKERGWNVNGFETEIR